MARIDLGIGTSHGPLLNTPPDEWGQRATADRRNPQLIYRGAEYTFDELRAERGGGFAAQCTPEVRRKRHAASRAAIDRTGEILRGADLDVLVVVSSDHKEIFDDEMLPPFAVYWGDTVDHAPYTQAQLDAMAPGLAIAEVANVPEVTTVRECQPELALHLIHSLGASGFDPGASRRLPPGRFENSGIPHGWGFVYQQLLGGTTDVPLVPVFVNTFYEPNPPTASRCYDFGVALGAAIGSWASDLRVGIVASGGLSHFVVDEELDWQFLDALLTNDADFMRGLAGPVLRSGTAELRNWIVVAGALAATDLAPRIIDYQPCYRSEAGTGCAMAFVSWEREEVPGD
ncbi:hypothetical protein GCM10022251_37900 [Phytohabitans flavus]|uniref:Extradiol ring-cleavage dioxygenase class III enzyme subunit B domain-containing protein n=1 Tax=Phytohabitans flavus TaxID=1076124 RepID=A0A6F8XVP2_9ACTN|nr:hypothetical protein [Phytohabitans flavus]BCB77895.1 hypothetical protein Pflav_043050 [Phytohabitans flavus]